MLFILNFMILSIFRILIHKIKKVVVYGQSKTSTVKWNKMNIGDQTKYRHAIDFQYTGPTRRACSLVDDSAFLAIIDKKCLIILFFSQIKRRTD